MPRCNATDRATRDISLAALVVISPLLAFSVLQMAEGGDERLGAALAGGALAVEMFSRRLRRKVRAIAEEAAAPQVLSAIMESSSEGVFITGTDGIIQQVNPAFTAITGYEAEEAVGRSPGILRSHHHTPDFYRELWRGLEENGGWQGEIWNRRKGGGVYLEWLTVRAVRQPGGETGQYVAVFSDISEKHAQQENLRHQANHDALTGLPNRFLLGDRLTHAIRMAERKGGRLAVIVLDLDRFKLINDSLGHNIGDALLRLVAQRLTGILREGDTVARIGGDEFVLLLPELSRPDHVSAVVDKVMAAFEVPFAPAGFDLHIRASMGVSLFPDDGAEAQALVTGAETAMYAVKQGGRNGHRFFAAGMNEAAAERLAMETGLHRALEQDELVVHYQPKIHLGDGRMIGMEALVRWYDPETGMVPPNRFIPVAEESGLISRVGERVLELVCRQIAQWRRDGHEFGPVAVNVSARQLAAPDFVERLLAIIEAAGIEPEAIELELTETAIMAEPDQAVKSFTRLAAVGVKLHLDDFGTGHSSLTYLRQLPATTLKVDGSFVREVLVTEGCAALVRSIIQLADIFSMAVVAECVETEAQAALLHTLGCTAAQGYLYSPALPADDLAARFLMAAPA